jgi:type VI secretion system protein ImpH
LAAAQRLAGSIMNPSPASGARRRDTAAGKATRAGIRRPSRVLTSTITNLYDRPYAQDFFDLCRRLESELLDKPRIGGNATRREDIARFGQEPFFTFAPSTISGASPAGDGVPTIYVKFLGLLGPQGAMPLGLTEEAYRYVQNNDYAFARFLDVLNTRFVQLFYRAWADARPVAHRDRPMEEDRFAAYLGSAIGLGSQTFRDLDSVDDLVKVGYAGLLGPKARSASRLSAALSALFGVKVAVEEFVGERLMIEPEQRSRLGGRFATLGRDMLLGAGVYCVQDKIRLRLFTASLEEYETFLPVGGRARALAEVVAFYLGLELKWDVELMLPVAGLRGAALGKSGRLGWTSWIAPSWTSEKSAYRGDARFDLMKRFVTTGPAPGANPS